MDPPVITALAALAGAAIGGLTSVVASWLTQRAQSRAQRLAHYQLRRQSLYKEFIELASKLFIHALQNDKADVSALMGLYAEISKMRVLSSARVVDSVDQIVKKIVHTYLEPNKTLPELRQMANSGLIDPLSRFQRGLPRRSRESSLRTTRLMAVIVPSGQCTCSTPTGNIMVSGYAQAGQWITWIVGSGDKLMG
jgi:hypothetical protein